MSDDNPTSAELDTNSLLCKRQRVDSKTENNTFDREIDDVISKHEATTPYFTVYPISRFDKAFPYYQKPEEIGSFSLDENRIFKYDRSELKCFVDPEKPTSDNNHSQEKIAQVYKSGGGGRVCLNLRHGYDTWIQVDETVKENLDHMLQWSCNMERSRKSIPDANDKWRSSLERLKSSDFMCWRGLLTKLLCTPYEDREGWILVAARFKGTIYLCEFDTEQKVKEKVTLQNGGRLREMTYWGVKFEQYVTALDSMEKPDTSKPVNSNQAFASVVQTKLGKNTLVFGGEVDCCTAQADKYIELKTSREIDSQNQRRNFKRFKLIKWWAQSFLIGIDSIICGFRDDNGIVHRLEKFDTASIPRYCSVDLAAMTTIRSWQGHCCCRCGKVHLAANSENKFSMLIQDLFQGWSATVCFNFCDQFLEYIKSVVQKDSNELLYVFSWTPRHDVICKTVSPDSEYAFLPDWFIHSSMKKTVAS